MLNKLASVLAGFAALTASASPVSGASAAAPSRFVIHFAGNAPGAACQSTTLSANIRVGNQGAFYIEGLPVSQTNGIPASLHGSSTNATLIFEDSNSGRTGDGAFLSPSSDRGVAAEVELVPNFSEFGWGYHGITTILSYGAPFANGTLPAFCQKTTPYIVAL